MSDSYTKLFSSITESTIWGEPAGTRLVWITMLAKCNRKGEFFGAIPGLARLANVTLAECESALETLLAPDRWSRTPDFEGRRIEAIDGGWRILNHAKFDRLRSNIEAEERELERKREWDRQNRPSGHARSKAAQSDDSPTESDVGPTQSVPPPAPTVSKSKSAKSDSNRGSRLPDGWAPSQSVRAWARQEFPTLSVDSLLAEFADYWRAVPGQKGRKTDWDATFRNRIRDVAKHRGVYATPAHRESASERVARINAEAEARETGGQGRVIEHAA